MPKRHQPKTQGEKTQTAFWQRTATAKRRGMASVSLTEKLLAQACRRFEQLFQKLPLACFCYDIQGTLIEWNRASQTLFHLPPEQALLKPVWEVIGRRTDIEITRALIKSVLTGQTYEGLEWEDTYPDGTARNLLCNAFPLRDSGGAIVGGISAHVDITERTRIECALRENDERWQLALRGNNDGIWDWNLRTGAVFVSARWKEILGETNGEEDCLANGEEVSKFLETWFQRVHPDDRDGAIQAFREHLDRATAFYSSEHRVQCRDGAYKWVLDRGQALWNRNGEALRVAGSFTDITERKRSDEAVREANQKLEEANQKLAALATTDGLTGIPNRRMFDERLAMEVERAHRYGFPLSLALLDVDHFKLYNDTYGHQAGDEVLKAVAQILQNSVREADMVARYGGEEFVLVLPHTDGLEALTVAEHCRAALEAYPWPERLATASFGIATFTDALTTAPEMIHAADRALYSSKQNGRNRLTHIDTLESAVSRG